MPKKSTPMIFPAQGFIAWYGTLTKSALRKCDDMVKDVKKEIDIDTGCIYCLLKDVDDKTAPRHQQGNPRIAFPKSFDVHQWIGKKKPVTWLVCAVTGNLPSCNEMECSHRCIKQDCINPDCLVWESRSSNQSRGSNGSDKRRICTRICQHENCGKLVCVCQKIHNPPCKP